LHGLDADPDLTEITAQWYNSETVAQANTAVTGGKYS